MLTDDELDLPQGETYDVIRRLHQKFRTKIMQHSKHYKCYQAIYYLAGGLAVVLSVIVGSLDPCSNEEVLPVLALTVACLTTCLNFFGIEGRVQRHDTASKQFVSLCLSIERFALGRVKTLTMAERLEESLLDRYKLVNAAEPDTSDCLTKKKQNVIDDVD